MENRNAIRAFIQKRVNHKELSDSDNIFKLGFVDSMFALQLVSFVEKEFSVVVEDDDLVIDNFNSVDAIERFVNSKVAGSVSSIVAE
ncbi:acyl carrier protein [Puniceicoccaceae bacterium K14]|nr:acyl carrier protein [Puniceicoccaceae bacterium K14]